MGRQRAVSRDLTPRQREVARLVAAGYSNREIGEQLGISAEGAKWHVGELLTKYGVDSREEVAAAWRAERGSPARRLLGWFAGSTALKVTAAAVAVAGLGVGLLFLLRDDSPEGPGELGPGIWVAITGPPPQGDPPQPTIAPIRVFDAVAGEERSFGPAALHFDVAWSPSGSHLAALGLTNLDESSRTFVRTWDSSGRVTGYFEYPSDRPGLLVPRSIAWSPDGSLLLLDLGSGLALFDSEARHLWTAKATLPDGSATFSGITPWAPDGAHVATQKGELLLVVDRDGRSGEYDLPRVDLGGAFTETRFAGWKSATELIVVARGGEPMAREFVGALERTRIAWDAGTPVDVSNNSLSNAELLERYRGVVPGRLATAARFGRSADGSALVIQLRERDPNSRLSAPAWIAVDLGGRLTIIDLGTYVAFPSTLIADVVVIPGWRGDAPTAVAAASPRPTATPTPTERPLPTPQPGSFDFIPYPAPRGERVPPLVADVPVFPGSHEIDGFTKDGLGNVQMFATSQQTDAVLEFFERELTALGYRGGGGSSGVTGDERAYTRGRDRVVVSTTYIPRPGDELPQGAGSYGFRGKGNRFEEKINGEYFFFVATLRAPEPR